MLNISNTLKTRTKKELKMTNKLTAIWGSLAPASAELFFFCKTTIDKTVVVFRVLGLCVSKLFDYTNKLLPVTKTIKFVEHHQNTNIFFDTL